MGDEPILVALPDSGGLLYTRDPGVAMLRCVAEGCRFGELPRPPESGDMRGEVNIGGLSGFMVGPDIGGL
jgi:hypothetical protein